MKEKISILNIIAALITLSLLIYALFGMDSCKRQQTPPIKKENQVDSLKIRKSELIKKFNCDTSFLFNEDDFSFRKNQILNQKLGYRLIEVDVLDIYEKNDSTYVFMGECWDEPFFGGKCMIEINRNDKSRFPNSEFTGLFVVKELGIVPTVFKDTVTTENQVIKAKCIYFEKM